MISYLKGSLEEKLEDSIIIEVNGVGYEVGVPASLIAVLPGIGSLVLIYTYLQVKEDGIALFGFGSREDLDFFKLLIGVSGIGPKGALAILSYTTPDQLRFAILSEDVQTISGAPGIGKKTAQRMIIELKDKISLEDAFEQKLAHSAAEGISTLDTTGETVQALVSLGYSQTEAMRAVHQVTLTEDMDTEAVLKAALKKLI